jgi:sec-independent protein translocase protein TatA
MFGSIGIPEIILIFVIVLLLFGPDKLPNFAKNFGKAVREFRKTLNEAKSTIEQEIEKADISQDIKEVNQDIQKIARMDIDDDNQPKQ